MTSRATGLGCPAEADGVIAAIVAAVRGGDDEWVRQLLPRLAECADVAALYALRDALADDLAAGAPPGPPARAGVDGAGPAGDR